MTKQLDPTKSSESSQRMIAAYPELHAQGFSNKDIATKFGVTDQTLLNHLGTIAKNMGVPRETLLTVPHTPPLFVSKSYQPVSKVDTTKLNNSLKTMKSSLNTLLRDINDMIKKHEEIAKQEEF